MCVSSSWLLEQGQPHHSPEQPRLVHVVITLGFTLGELGQRYAENSQVCQREAPQTWLLHKHELQQGRIPIETKKKKKWDMGSENSDSSGLEGSAQLLP